MPVYNGEKYIRKAVESVYEQGVSLELLVIDDGSTDHTEAVSYTHLIEVEDGISVLEAEIQAGLRPDAPCGGLGKCGKCLVCLLYTSPCITKKL